MMLSHALITLIATNLLLLLLLLNVQPAPATDDFIVELLLTVDAKGIEKWKTATGQSEDELKKELSSYVVEVNQVYKSLSQRGSDLTISFAEPELVLLDRNIAYGFDGMVNVDVAKSAYKSWTQTNKKTFDIAILFTGYDMESRGDTSTAGHANFGTVCRDDGVTVVELSGRFIDPLLMAHELGHVLNVDHDGIRNSSDCAAADLYVMSPILMISAANKYFFSECSYNTLVQFLVKDGRGKECLTNGKENIVKGPRLGAIVSPDSACQRRYGTRSKVNREWYAERGYKDNLCQQLRCDAYINDRADPSLPWVATHQGMSCGTGKRCEEGLCKTTMDRDKTGSNTCPLGDQATDISKGKKCSSLTLDDCYSYQVECCQTCSKFKDTAADKACRELHGPKSSLVRDRYSEWGDELCQTLYCVTEFHQEFYAKKYDTPEGLDCGKNKKCKDKKCVLVTSGGDPNMTDKCPYGDQPWIPIYRRTCPQQIDYYGCSRHRWAPMCCKTCYDTLYEQ